MTSTTTKKEEDVVNNNNVMASSASLECCMCGDSGLTQELFQCKVCQFRSQHRYCSNLYPEAETYKACNWCLIQKEDSKEKSQNSCNSSASCKQVVVDDDSNNNKNKNNGSSPAGLKPGQRTNSSGLQLLAPVKNNNNMIKKPKSPEMMNKSPLTRKRIISNAKLEEKIRRTKSEEISANNTRKSSSSIITRQVFRNKVRRYKLLDEVSS